MGREINIIDVDNKNKGLLVIEGKSRRTVTVMVEKLEGAEEEDTMKLMEEIKVAYSKYFECVKGGIVHGTAG